MQVSFRVAVKHEDTGVPSEALSGALMAPLDAQPLRASSSSLTSFELLQPPATAVSNFLQEGSRQNPLNDIQPATDLARLPRRQTTPPRLPHPITGGLVEPRASTVAPSYLHKGVVQSSHRAHVSNPQVTWFDQRDRSEGECESCATLGVSHTCI